MQTVVIADVKKRSFPEGIDEVFAAFGGIKNVIPANQTVSIKPNAVSFNKRTYTDPAVLDAFKYTKSGVITEEMMAALFGVSRVLVGNARYKTSNEGQSDALDYVWGKNSVLLYTPGAPSRFTPAATYTFVFIDRVVETYREPEHSVTVVRVREEVDEVVTSTACCYLIKDAVS